VYELFLLLATCTATLAERDGYTVCYDTQNQRPLWTIHQPRPSATPTPRKHWRKDHPLNSLPTSAFTNSGFDRGHLATAADLPESQDTFLTSNAVPQIQSLNRGQWRALENEIRKLRPIRVLTGAVYANCGNEQLEAPCFLYKLAILEDGQILADYAQNAPPRQ
jgi:endonuclease G